MIQKILQFMLVITLSVGLTYGYCQKKNVSQPVVKLVPQKMPMSVKDLQTFLNEQHDPWGRYECKIDGIFGSETKKALDNWLNDRAYSELLEADE